MGKDTFENNMTRLEEIVKKLESGELSLEDSLIDIEEGLELSRLYTKKSNESERKVEILVKQEEGLASTSFSEEV